MNILKGLLLLLFCGSLLASEGVGLKYAPESYGGYSPLRRVGSNVTLVNAGTDSLFLGGTYNQNSSGSNIIYFGVNPIGGVNGDMYGWIFKPSKTDGTTGKLFGAEAFLANSQHTGDDQMYVGLSADVRSQDASNDSTQNVGFWSLAAGADLNLSAWLSSGWTAVGDSVSIGLWDRRSGVSQTIRNDQTQLFALRGSYPFHFLDWDTLEANQTATQHSFYLEKKIDGASTYNEAGAVLHLRRNMSNLNSEGGYFLSANDATNDVTRLTSDGRLLLGPNIASYGGGANNKLVMTSSNTESYFHLQNTGSGFGGSDGFQFITTNNAVRLYNYENSYIELVVNNGADQLRYNSTGDLLLGTTTAPSAGGGKAMIFGDTGTAPTPGTNTAAIFGDDVAGTVHMFATEEGDGTGTQLSSHNSKGEPIHFSYSSKTGKATYINLVALAKSLEMVTGEKLVYQSEFDKNNPGLARIELEKLAGDFKNEQKGNKK